MIYPIHIDLAHIDSKKVLFDAFAEIFHFPEFFGYNWDAFFDCMQNLDADSQGADITSFHIIFSGYDVFVAHFPDEDIAIFHRIFFELCMSSDFREDHCSFTFEISH